MNEVQKHILKQARVHLINVQTEIRAFTEEYKKLDELIAGIEELLGIQ